MQTELQIFPRAHVEPTLPNEHIAAIHWPRRRCLATEPPATRDGL